MCAHPFRQKKESNQDKKNYTTLHHEREFMNMYEKWASANIYKYL